MDDMILHRYFSNEATPAEMQQIEEWLMADPARQKEFDAAHMLYNAMVLQQAHYHEPPVGSPASVGPLRRIGRIALRVAAAVVLVVGAGYVGQKVEQGRVYQTMSSRMNVLEVPAGQRITLSLEDGTTVHLNGGSRLEYPLLFAKDRRHVKLSGEALFDVTHNPRQPFVVETFASQIEVLGTRFNVFADERNNRFSAILVAGGIRVTNLLAAGQESIVLNPDEMVRLVDGHLVMSRVLDKDALCWTEGYINIRDVAFDELMQRFEKAYDVQIVIDRTTLPRVGYASGKIRISEGVEFALELLSRTSDFTFEKHEDSNTIIIR